MCETSQVSSGCAPVQRLRDRPAALGAARVVAAVGAHAEDRAVVRRQPARAAGAERAEVEVEDLARRRRRVPDSSRGRDRVGVGRRTPAAPAPSGFELNRRISRTFARWARARCFSAGAEPVGQPGVQQRVVAPRARRARAAARCARGWRCRPTGSSRSRLSAAQRRAGSTEVTRSPAALRGPAAGRAPAGSASSSGEVAGREARAGADLLEGRAEPRRHGHRPVAEQHLDLVAAVEQHAGMAGAPAQPGGRR